MAWSEYRAFRLGFKDAEGQVLRTLVTTLDDIQYRGYFPVPPNERVEIQATWMCWGRTDENKAICSQPNVDSLPSQSPQPSVKP